MYDLVCSESFDLKKTEEYILSIQVSLGGFSFSVVNTSDKNVLAFKEIPVKISTEALLGRRLNEWIETEEILQSEYSKVFVVICLEKFTLVPENYFLNESKFTASDLLFGEEEDSQVLNNSFDRIPYHLLFNAPENLVTYIQGRFKNVEFIHPVKPIIEKVLNLPDENNLILYFSSKTFYFVLVSNNNLQLANSFNYTHINDVVYFVVTTLKQLNIKSKQVKLLLSGDMSNNVEMEETLIPYFKSVSYLETTHVSNSEIIAQPLYKFITII